MLNVDKLSSDITNALKETLPDALTEALKVLFPCSSKSGEDMAKKFGDTASELIAEPLGERLGNAIHAYIKNISISGTIITVGSMTTQTAQVAPATPVTGGKIPNTLGIS